MEFLSDALLQAAKSIRDHFQEVEINDFQCRRLLNRTEGIVERLEELKTILEGEDHDYFLTLLKRIRTLIIGNGGPEWFERALIRANNKEVFQEVHNELKTFVEKITGFTSTTEGGTEIKPAALSPTTDLLNQDAERDLEEMLGKLQILQRTLKENPNPELSAEHVKKLIKVISDRSKLEIAGDHAAEHDVSASYLQIPDSEIDRKEVIGTGSYGDVYRADWLGCTLVLKDFPWSGGYSKQWLNQAIPLLKLRHPNVLQLVGFSPSEDDSEESKVLTEIMQGDIRWVIERKMKENNGEGVPFDWAEALDIMTQVARGLNCMHQNGFMHGDRVLTTNIVVNEHGDYVDARIGDYGVPQDIPFHHVHNCEPRLGDPIGAQTARWMAPEICDPAARETARYSVKNDVYSFGMFCYELLTGRKPFDDIPDVAPVYSQIVAGLRPKLPEYLDERIMSIIQECWHVDPSLRPTAQKILKDLEDIQFPEKKPSSVRAQIGSSGAAAQTV